LSPAGSRVELYSAIRRDARAGPSNRALQRKNRVGYRPVAAALASAWPTARKPPPKRGSRLDPYVEVIDDRLRDDLDAPRKQRHTAKRIFDRLLDEHHAVGVVSYSGKAVHRISASAGQEAFFEGHAYAFEVLGGVPTGKIRYDNLKAAVASVTGLSGQRVEADRWTAFRSHYGIEAFYCQPGAVKGVTIATWRMYTRGVGPGGTAR
jgi:transposase